MEQTHARLAQDMFKRNARACALLHATIRPHLYGPQDAYVDARARSICQPGSRTRRAPARGAQPDECPAVLAQAGLCRDARYT